MYLGQLIWPMFAMGWVLSLLERGRAAWARLEPVLREPPSIDDRGRVEQVAGGALVFEAVSFAYPGQSARALVDVSIDLAPGHTLGVVGPTGAGKSTLVSLLLRFREYDAGTILLGGRELRSMAADDVRAAIALVPQRVHLFDATIRDNLSLADDELSEERMRRACAIACIDTVVEALPEGYDTRIGEDGVRLSGGERQRLAIARAILREAPILILDEATSDLDEDTERRVLDALQPFLRGRTTLLVTHRPSVAARADRVVELSIPAED
jgi:ATP-binding cassette subfamily B protein/ATP-binding cassette subfamily C protein/ATP-binding cassette subfamily B multidrug efflux pump